MSLLASCIVSEFVSEFFVVSEFASALFVTEFVSESVSKCFC